MTTRNFNVKNGLTVGTATIDATSGNANLGNVAATLGAFTTISGEGGNISNIQGANVSGAVSSATTAGTVTANAQSNITSLGTLTGLTVNGTSNLGAVGNVIITGGTSGYYLQTNGSGVLTWAAVPTGTGISNGTSNVNIATSGGNVTTSVAGNANILVVTGTGVNVAGTLNSSGNANVNNLGTAQVLATANITAPQVIANVANGTSPFLVNSQTVVANLNADLLDGYNTAVAATANTVAVRNADGNITANYFIGNGSQLTGLNTDRISNGNSNVAIPTANGNVNITAVGNTTLVITGTGVNVAGTLNATGNANVGNIGAATAVITTGNITTINSGLMQNGNSNIAITANANITLTAKSNATLVISDTGANITGTANVSGNASAGNFTTAGQVVATGNVTSSANLVSDNIIGRTGALTIKSAGTNTNINLQPNGTGNIDANSAYITNVKSPFNLNDAATKGYVDTLISTGISVHTAVVAATTTTLATATGGTITYNNGTAGVGATLTTTGTFNLIDTANVQTVGTRILVKNEANAAHNGIYTYTNTTTITRATDADTYGAADPDALGQNDLFFVSGGSVNKDTSWIVSTVGTITFGTTAINFSQFSATQDYTAGTGLTLSPNLEFSITNTAVTTGTYGNGDRVAQFTVNQQGQLTAAANVVIAANAANLTGTTLNSSIINSNLSSVGTITTGTWNSTFTAGLNANTLANIQGGNVSGAVASATAATNAAAVLSNATTTNTVYLLGTQTAANGNVSLEKVTGITANFAANSITATTFNGNVVGSNGTFTYVRTTGNTGVTLQILGGVQNTANTAGGGIQVIGATGNGSGAGGLVQLAGGAADISGGAGVGNGVGGAISIAGGSGWAGGTGGNVTISSGASDGYGSNIILGGAGNTTSGAGGTITVNGGLANGTNKVGGAITIAGGRGTGTGQPGNIVFQTPDTTTSGSTAQTLANRIVISGNVVNVTTSVAATSTTSGALVVVGGMGVAGNVYAGAFYGAATGLTSIPGANVTGAVGSATNAAAVQSNTSTTNTVYLLGTATAANGNVSLEKVSGITANYSANSIIATTFNGNVIANAANGVVFGNNITASGAASGNINVATVTGNLGIRALASTYTDNVAAAGTIGNAAIHAIAAPTVAASNAITTTNLATFYIANAPTAGTNVTITNRYALYVGGGNSLFNGNVSAGNISATNANVTTANVSGNVIAGNVYANSGTIGASSLTGTLTTAAQTNITSVGTLSNLAVTGNVTAGNVRLNGGLTSNRSNVSIGTNTVIDQFAPGTFRTAKYIISASGDFGYQSIETLLVHDNTDAYITIYGSISSNVSSELINLSANINGVSGNVSLYASNIGANVKVNVVSSYIQI